MTIFANEVLKSYFDLYMSGEDTFIDEIYIAEEIERLSEDLMKCTKEEQDALAQAAKNWLDYFSQSSEMHVYTRRLAWTHFDVEFLEHIASGEFRTVAVYNI